MQGAKVLHTGAVVVGVILIAAAAVTAFFVTPNYVARLPDDTNTQRSYAGTFKTLLDPQAVAQGNLVAALKQNVPLTVDRRVKVEQTSGDTALVSDARTTGAAGTTIEKTTWQYALDRRSLEPAAKHPSSWSVIDAQGLTVSWPIHAKKQTYTGWVPETAATTPVAFSHSENHAGLTAYVYQVTAAPAPITDSQVLAPLPKALPQSLLKLVAQLGPLTPAAKLQLTALLPTLGDPVPISYTQQENDTFWVEPETGVVIDVNRSQQRAAGVKNPNGGAFIELLPVIDATYQQTPQSVQAAVHDAQKGRKAIELYGSTLPALGAALGIVLVLAGVLLGRRDRRRRQEQPGNPREGRPENPPEDAAGS
ncbi:porin PorA family protein [Kitasatospora sp. MAP5-34]|uniref:porin PorA family protein n=1 Tax=Kitasatospora sp. MAP5-34 TaxID=3035102 RepID=UPI002472E821|nr:porin PorA family protein [Kitasatospora sp. MAP5-34]MDH6574983.1 hypothetical protein [Kitasatospora sp. MAP5-34]